MKDYKQILENAKGMIDEVSQRKIKGLIAGRKRQADAAADQLTNVNKAYLGVTGKPKLGTIHPKTVGTVGKAAQGDDRLIDAGNVFRKQEMIARRKQWDAEWRLKGNKGKDPRNEEVTTNEYTEPVTEAKDAARAKHNAAVLRAAGGAKAYQAQKMAKRPILDKEISEFVERLNAKQIILLKKLIAARIAAAAELLRIRSGYQGGNQIGNDYDDYPGYKGQGGNQIGNY